MGGGILTGPAIAEAVQRGKIFIEGFDPRHVNPASYDLTLGDTVAVYESLVCALPYSPEDGRRFKPYEDEFLAVSDNHVLKALESNPVKTFKIDPEVGWVLKPGIGYLMHTKERVRTDFYVPVLDGKALALDTPIPTPGGWKTMGTLQVGDVVYDGSGKPTRVTAVTAPMLGRPCYRLTFTDGTEVVADAQHQWHVYPVDANPGVRTTEQLTRRKHRKGQSIFWVPAVAIEGSSATLLIPPYTLGVWLGDGHKESARVTGHNDDAKVLGEVARDGFTVEPRTHVRQVTTSIVGRRPPVRDCLGRFDANGSLHTLLKDLGVLGDKHIPDAYKKADHAQRLELLQGLMDTDGAVHRDDQASITLTNQRLFDDVEDLCRSLGLVTYRDERPAKVNGKVVGTAYRLTWRATPEMFRLPRKQAKVRNTSKWLQAARSPKRGIRDIQSVPSVPVRCITVEASDGLFLATRAYIRTHNSTIGRLFVQVHVTAGYGDPGFDGQYTLEVVVTHPVRVFPGMRICQIRFHTAHGRIKLYDGRYRGERACGAVPAETSGLKS